MDSWLIEGVAPLAMDDAIHRALLGGLDAGEGGGIALNLGILAEDGRVYRMARAWDLADYRRGTAALERLGLVLAHHRPAGLPLVVEDLFARPGQTDPDAAARRPW